MKLSYIKRLEPGDLIAIKGARDFKNFSHLRQVINVSAQFLLLAPPHGRKRKTRISLNDYHKLQLYRAAEHKEIVGWKRANP